MRVNRRDPGVDPLDNDTVYIPGLDERRRVTSALHNLRQYIAVKKKDGHDLSKYPALDNLSSIVDRLIADHSITITSVESVVNALDFCRLSMISYESNLDVINKMIEMILYNPQSTAIRPQILVASDAVEETTWALMVERLEASVPGFARREAGLTLCVGLPDEAITRQKGERWQEDHSNLDWNMFQMPRREGIAFEIINPSTNKALVPGAKMSGHYVRWLDRVGRTNLVKQVLIYGPFETSEMSHMFGMGRAAECGDDGGYCCLGYIEHVDQFIVTKYNKLTDI